MRAIDRTDTRGRHERRPDGLGRAPKKPGLQAPKKSRLRAPSSLPATSAATPRAIASALHQQRRRHHRSLRHPVHRRPSLPCRRRVRQLSRLLLPLYCVRVHALSRLPHWRPRIRARQRPAPMCARLPPARRSRCSLPKQPDIVTPALTEGDTPSPAQPCQQSLPLSMRPSPHPAPPPCSNRAPQPPATRFSRVRPGMSSRARTTIPAAATFRCHTKA